MTSVVLNLLSSAVLAIACYHCGRLRAEIRELTALEAFLDDGLADGREYVRNRLNAMRPRWMKKEF